MTVMGLIIFKIKFVVAASESSKYVLVKHKLMVGEKSFIMLLREF